MLLSELGDIVQFGKAFTHYEESSAGRVISHFEDGSTAEGDVLVAADGGGSRVRRQFLPDARRTDTGVVGIAGKVFLNATNRRRLAAELLGGMSLVSARGLTLFVALQDLDGDRAGEIGGNEPPATSDAHFDNTGSYLMWALGGRRATLGLDGDVDRVDAGSLRAIALQEQAIPQNRARLLASRALFRIADRLPPLKRWMFSNMGDE